MDRSLAGQYGSFCSCRMAEKIANLPLSHFNGSRRRRSRKGEEVGKGRVLILCHKEVARISCQRSGGRHAIRCTGIRRESLKASTLNNKAQGDMGCPRLRRRTGVNVACKKRCTVSSSEFKAIMQTSGANLRTLSDVLLMHAGISNFKGRCMRIAAVGELQQSRSIHRNCHVDS